MADRPILFSGPMVRALLEGRKTQTRRVVKPRADKIFGPRCILQPHEIAGEVNVDEYQNCHYGKPGDLLWVRETCAAKELTTQEADAMWKASPDYDGLPPDHLYGRDGVVFSADNVFAPIKNTREAADAWVDLNSYRGKRGATVPPIHMPRWASRLTLRIVDVRVQRLNDINGLDAMAEGLVDLGIEGARWHWDRTAKSGHFAPWRAYRALWESVNGPGSWDANPWVWALTFEVIPRNVDAVLLELANAPEPPA